MAKQIKIKKASSPRLKIQPVAKKSNKRILPIFLVLIAIGVGVFVVSGIGCEKNQPKNANTETSSKSVKAKSSTAVKAAPAKPSRKVKDSDFVVISSPINPRVAYALIQNNGTFSLYLDVDKVGESRPEIKVGLDGGKTKILDSNTAKKTQLKNKTRFAFNVPKTAIAGHKSDVQEFKMGIDVRWPGGALGKDRRHERFLHTNPASAHSGLSPDSNNWIMINFSDYAKFVKDRQNVINIALDQPMDGKYTIVIEDKDGKRVRNLVAGATHQKGPITVEWDGLDDDGNLVKPGTYKWRSAHHPGIKPEYLMAYGNGGEKMFIGFGSNHSRFVHAASNGKYAFFAAPMTEGGWEMIAVDDKGNWKKGFHQAYGTPIQWVQVAADDKVFYTVHDGTGGGQKVDKNNPKWTRKNKITLTRFDIESTRPIDYPGRKHFIQLAEYEYGPGAKDAKMHKQYSVTGAALLKGKLYIACRHSQKVMVVDPATGKITKEFTLKNPGSLAEYKGKIYAVTGDSVISFGVDGTGKKAVLKKTGLDIHGICLDPKGRIFLSDHKSHTVKCYSQKGKLQATIGKPGGPYKGKYDPERMVRPLGLVVHNGWLWVTEDRWNPKRVLAWDLKTKKVVAQKYGCPHYGSPGGGFDFDDHSKWIGLGATWKVDLKNKKAEVASILQPEEGHLDHYYKLPFRYTFYKKDGRTFLLAAGKINMVCELLPDGSVKDLAAISGLHQWAYACGWKLPKEMEKALPPKYLKMKEKHYRTNETRKLGVLWVDKNGDGSMQGEEFSFTEGAEGFAHSWGNNQKDLTLRLPIRDKGNDKILMLKPNGFYPSGAPKYPKLKAAVAKAIPWQEQLAFDYRKSLMPTTVDRKNNMIYNTDPKMVAVSPQGKILWHYPNKWVGVHGSHNAPLPETGVMQGNLFFLGCAPLDKDSDVFVLNGNHGRFSILSSDGLYLDEMFRDVRTGRDRNALMVGGEPFGGFFGRSKKDDQFYLQTGGDGYRIYRLKGLHELKRNQGEIKITKEQIMASERKLARKQTEAAKAKEAVVLETKTKPKIDGNERDWENAWNVDWSKKGQFPVKVKVSYDKDNLYLYYYVRDESPWVNNGNDWTALFKTGDSVDLQIATDRSAKPNRSKPVPGDMRLLIAPFDGKPTAVLYQHRVKGKKNPVTFNSPWRSETVDIVKKLDNVEVKVQKRAGWYKLEAAIPLKELGIKSLKGKEFKADFGVIYGDKAGTINFLRNYWANQATGLVNDVPGEIMLNPNQWGKVKFK